MKQFKINNCDECGYYRYERCVGYDCFHPEAQLLHNNRQEDDKEEEPLAENRIGDFPEWCPAQNIDCGECLKE